MNAIAVMSKNKWMEGPYLRSFRHLALAHFRPFSHSQPSKSLLSKIFFSPHFFPAFFHHFSLKFSKGCCCCCQMESFLVFCWTEFSITRRGYMPTRTKSWRGYRACWFHVSSGKVIVLSCVVEAYPPFQPPSLSGRFNPNHPLLYSLYGR